MFPKYGASHSLKGSDVWALGSYRVVYKGHLRGPCSRAHTKGLGFRA